MQDVLSAFGLLAVLGLAFAAGRRVHAALDARHTGPDTLAFVGNSASLLVTLTAIVLGLLLTSVNASFTEAGDDLRRYAATLVLLDRDFDALGAPMAPARADLRRYVASVLASDWPGEPPPPGAIVERGHGDEIDSLQLGDLLQPFRRGYAAPDAEAARVQGSALDHAAAALDGRWALIGEAHSSITPQSLAVVSLWLALLFPAFGLIAPRNRVGIAASGFVALSVAGAVFLAMELDGLVTVSSEPLRHALFHIDRAPGAPVPAETGGGRGAWSRRTIAGCGGGPRHRRRAGP